MNKNVLYLVIALIATIVIALAIAPGNKQMTQDEAPVSATDTVTTAPVESAPAPAAPAADATAPAMDGAEGAVDAADPDDITGEPASETPAADDVPAGAEVSGEAEKPADQ